MMLVAVNYHYIGDEDRFRHGIHPVSVARFEKQISALGSTFSFVSKQDVLDAIDGTRVLPERAALITFDDGLRGQYTEALPVLDRMGIPALFFINGMPHAESKALQIHKVHWLRAHVAPEEFLGRLTGYVTALAGKPFKTEDYPVSDEVLRARYKYGEPAELRLKYLLYSGLPRMLRDAVIDHMFAETAGDEKAFCADTYISAAGLADLGKRNFLGIHGYAHEPIGALSPTAQREEMQKCVTAVADAAAISPDHFQAISYPYGTADAVSDETVRLAGNMGFRLGFTMERAINRSFADPLRLGRVDANDIPEGKKPLFAIEQNMIKIIDPLLI